MSPAVIDLDGGVTTIDAGFHRPGMAASHLVVDSGRAAFVDVGTSHTAPLLLDVLRSKGLEPADVDLVMVTHIHLDHAGGAGTLMQSLPNARLVVHPRGARHMIDPSRLVAGAAAIYGQAVLDTIYGPIVPVPAERVIEAGDGLELELGGRKLRFLDAPGHARHHYCVVDEASHGVFTGDAFGLSYRWFDTDAGPWLFPSTSPVHFDPEEMRHTVERLVATGARWAYLTHFGRISDLDRRAQSVLHLMDETVHIALRFADRSMRRHRAIVTAVWELFLTDLRRHGCTLDEREIRTLLGVDVALNAQGLEVWLDGRTEAR